MCAKQVAISMATPRNDTPAGIMTNSAKKQCPLAVQCPKHVANINRNVQGMLDKKADKTHEQRSRQYLVNAPLMQRHPGALWGYKSKPPYLNLGRPYHSQRFQR